MQTRQNAVLLIAVLVSSSLITIIVPRIARAAEGRIPIGESKVLTDIPNAGSYILTGDIDVPSGDALTISHDDVFIDLGGHTINATSGWAISSIGHTNIKVSNGQISGANGIGFSNPGGNFTIEDLNITISDTSTGDGIVVTGGTGNLATATVRRNKIVRGIPYGNNGIIYSYCRGVLGENRVTNFGTGIRISSATDAYIKNNFTSKCLFGIALNNATYCAITGNTSSENNYGMYVDGTSTYNAFIGNIINGNQTDGLSLQVNSGHNVLTGNTSASTSALGGINIWSCYNIISDNKAPGTAISCSTVCNLDGGGNTPPLPP